jgi:CRP/FNR family transcriptional regulator, cyclic AMP receptor protein
MNVRLRRPPIGVAAIRRCKNAAVAELLSHCAELPRRTVAAGSLVIEQGAPGGAVLVLVDGRVAIERDGERLAVLDTPGAMLGEMSTVLDRPSSATVRALTDVTLLEAIDGAAFLTEHPEALLEVARTLATRLDNLTGHLVDVKRQYGGTDTHLGMLDDVLSTLVHDQPRRVTPGSARLPDPDY